MRSLSELEGCVLGHLWKHGACTPYAVRREFLGSPSSHWSGSAGAIYPLLARLEKAGLVSWRRVPRGGRGGRRYSLTANGRRRFLSWLEPPFAAFVASLPPDPIRTRIHFLGALPEKRRDAFFSAAVAQLRRGLALLSVEADADAFDSIARRGARSSMRSRIRWLEEARVTSPRVAPGPAS